MRDEIKNKLIASVKTALERYTKGVDTTAGIHLTSYVKKGLLKPKSAEDADLLQQLSGLFPKDANVYIFLRKAKTGAFLADEEAITKLFAFN